MALAGAPRQVDLRHILDNFLRETSQSLNGLVEELPAQEDAVRCATPLEVAVHWCEPAASHPFREACCTSMPLFTAGKLVQ